MYKGIVHDRTSGNVYYGLCMVSQEGFITIQDPIRRDRASKSIHKFKKGTSFVDCVFEEYGEKCRDLMLPTHTVFLELLNDNDIVGWAGTTKEAVEKKLEAIAEEAKRVHDAEKKAFLDKKSKFGRFLYKLFG